MFKSLHDFQIPLQLKDRYENILEHLDCGIILFNASGRIRYINMKMARIFEVSSSSLIGCSLTQLLRHQHLNRSTKRRLLSIYKEAIFNRKANHELCDNEGRHWLINITYGEDMDGDFLFSAKDVTNYKKMEESAYQNDKLAMLGKISASIAHEIRNPLTSIRGFMQLLRSELKQLGKDEYAKIILSEIDRANDIISEFLNSSKPSMPNKTIVNVSSLLNQVILLSESEALMKGCQIFLHNVQGFAFILVDMKQIKQVLLNIIKNAMDAMDDVVKSDGGKIEVYTSMVDDHVRIHVSDNGKGMDRNTMLRLFEPFYTTKDSGTGLGLSVSYGIINNHGGVISVESEEGKGTQFMISLPCAK
ncbi:two-component system sensor histidine kinase NtrB [Paenibacillus sp. CMAA1364]